MKSMSCIIRPARGFCKHGGLLARCHSFAKLNDHLRREEYFICSSCDAAVPRQALTCRGNTRPGEEESDRDYCLLQGHVQRHEWLLVAPQSGSDLALYSVPVVVLWFGDALSLQLLEHSSAWWQRAVDITQKSLRVGVTVSDKAVIQLLQLIRKTILLAQRRHVSFRDTIESCFRQRLIVCVCVCECVYCNGWGTLTGCSC